LRSDEPDAGAETALDTPDGYVFDDPENYIMTSHHDTNAKPPRSATSNAHDAVQTGGKGGYTT